MLYNHFLELVIILMFCPIKNVINKSIKIWVTNSDTLDMTPRACTTPNFHVKNNELSKANTSWELIIM